MSAEMSTTPIDSTTVDGGRSSLKLSATPPKERVSDSKEPTRISRKRTKTGCLTCRKRRIKCGEEKPHCNNCIKSKRMCDYKARAAFRRFPFHHIQDTNNFNYQPMPMPQSGFPGHSPYDYHMHGIPYGAQTQSPVLTLPPHYTQSSSFMNPAFSHGRSASCDTLPPFWSGPNVQAIHENGHDASSMGFSVTSMPGSHSYHSSPSTSAEPQSAPMHSSWSSDNGKHGRPVLSKIMTNSPQSRDIGSFHNASRIQKRPQLSSLSLGRRTVSDWYNCPMQDDRNSRQDFGAPATAPPFRHEHGSPYPWASITPESDSSTPSSARPDLSSGMDHPLFSSEPMSAPQFNGMVSPFSPDMSRWLPPKSCMPHQEVKPIFESNIKELGPEDSFEHLLEPRTPIDAQHSHQSLMTAKV